MRDTTRLRLEQAAYELAPHRRTRRWSAKRVLEFNLVSGDCAQD